MALFRDYTGPVNRHLWVQQKSIISAVPMREVRLREPRASPTAQL